MSQQFRILWRRACLFWSIGLGIILGFMPIDYSTPIPFGLAILLWIATCLISYATFFVLWRYRRHFQFHFGFILWLIIVLLISNILTTFLHLSFRPFAKSLITPEQLLNIPAKRISFWILSNFNFTLWVNIISIAFFESMHRLFTRIPAALRRDLRRSLQKRKSTPQPLYFDYGFFVKLKNIDPQDILIIKAEEHYISVQNATETELILYRFSDALLEVDNALNGQQVHRSWWIAQDAMQALEQDGRKAWIITTNGKKVPVSRSWINIIRQKIPS
ncbi:MAG: LytTR family DNA-binding domain-containing protein [Alphaproteobacteria bacterium]